MPTNPAHNEVTPSIQQAVAQVCVSCAVYCETAGSLCWGWVLCYYAVYTNAPINMPDCFAAKLNLYLKKMSACE